MKANETKTAPVPAVAEPETDTPEGSTYIFRQYPYEVYNEFVGDTEWNRVQFNPSHHLKPGEKSKEVARLLDQNDARVYAMVLSVRWFKAMGSYVQNIDISVKP